MEISKIINNHVIIIDDCLTGPLYASTGPSSSLSESLSTDTFFKSSGKMSPPDFPKKCIEKSGDFDTLVISGGSVQGIIILGAIQFTVDNFLLNKINTYIGTSVGAICIYLLIIGYTPSEIMAYICTHQITEQLKNINLVSMFNRQGALSFSIIYEQLEKMTIEKIGKLITMGDLFVLYKKTFICVTYNKTLDKPELLSHLTYPDMPCLIALRMSSNLPILFEDFKYMGNYYIDGGIVNNFPIDIGDTMGNKILGISMCCGTKFASSFSEESMLSYVYKLISVPMNQSVIYRIEKASEKCSIVQLSRNGLNPLNFDLDVRTKLDMFSDGYTQIKKYFSNDN
jgi:predicted acylesterase/phospholipase RssA